MNNNVFTIKRSFLLLWPLIKLKVINPISDHWHIHPKTVNDVNKIHTSELCLHWGDAQTHLGTVEYPNSSFNLQITNFPRYSQNTTQVVFFPSLNPAEYHDHESQQI